MDKTTLKSNLLQISNQLDTLSLSADDIKGNIDHLINNAFTDDLDDAEYGDSNHDRPGPADRDAKLLWYPGADLRWQGRLRGRGPYKSDSGLPIGAVFHTTSGCARDNLHKDADNTLNWAQQCGHGYFLIDRDGTIFQMIPLNQYGIHVKDSNAKHNEYTRLNNKYVGIEMMCCGMVKKVDQNIYKGSYFNQIIPRNKVECLSKKMENIHPGCYHIVTQEQIESAIELMCWMKNNDPDNFMIKNITTHDECEHNRKTDPGYSWSYTAKQLRDVIWQECHERGIV